MKTEHQIDEAIGDIRAATDQLISAMKLLYTVQRNGVLLTVEQIEKIEPRLSEIRANEHVLRNFVISSTAVSEMQQELKKHFEKAQQRSA